MTHDLQTSTIQDKQYVLVRSLGKISACKGCAFDRDKINNSGGCVELVRGATMPCYDNFIFIPNTPEAIADHIAQRLENT
jgi:hypothetical protein